MKIAVLRFSLSVVAVLLAGFTEQVWALQVHDYPEGLVAHQLAHAFFVATMVLLVYWLEKNHLVEEKGWRLIQTACGLLIFWNLVAFAGHMVARNVDPAAIVGEKGSINQTILLEGSPWTFYYYVLHLDHLVCVPAMLCLFLGIRSLYRNMGEERDASS